MEDLSKIVAGVTMIFTAVGTIVARYRGTNPEKSFFDRFLIAIDFTQPFDSTRKLND